MEPIFSHPHHFVSSSTTKIILATIAVLAGLIGIGVATAVWLLHRVKADQLEPKVFENAMYIDATYSKIVGGVGHKAFEMISNADKKYVDGAINQIGKSTIKLGVIMRPLQSGYMRNYCLLYTSPSPRDRTRSRMPSSA